MSMDWDRVYRWLMLVGIAAGVVMLIVVMVWAGQVLDVGRQPEFAYPTPSVGFCYSLNGCP